MTITVRGSAIGYINNSESATISFPAGATAGDYSVLFVEHGAVPNPILGWNAIDFKSVAPCGALYERVLTASDISAGSVSLGFGLPAGASGYGMIALVTFVGSLAGHRTFVSASTASGATSRTITTDSTPQAGDYAVAFATGRLNGAVSSGLGSALQTTTNAQASGVVAGQLLGSSGSVSDTFSFASSSNGDYCAILVVAPSPISTLNVRAPLVALEPLVDASTNDLRAAFMLAEPLAEGNRNLLVDLFTVEPLAEGFRSLRMAEFIIEALQPVAPEGTVSTELFPGSLGSPVSLPGLAFTVHKRPTFSTAKYKGVSGVGVRRANMQYPVYEIELSYEFLRDDVTNEYRTLRRFFKQRKGGFDTFLLKDKDDYIATNETLGTADGVTTQFPFLYDAQTEKVGQVDNGNTITIYHTPAGEAHTIPNAGPYTITISHPQSTSPTITQDLGVTFAIGGTALTAVGGAPAAGQYSVNLATGVYTFNSADANKGVKITYRYVALPANYTITLPNAVVFTTAPTAGTISGDFQFFYNCVFQDDVADFGKFADKFWELQKIVLETVPQ